MKFYKQLDAMDCGPTCLRMITKHYGKNFSLQTLRDLCQVSREGASLLDISEAAEKIGFRSVGVKIELSTLKEIELPCILHWQQNHFVILYKIKKKKYHIADPIKGLITYTEKELMQYWAVDSMLTQGIALLLTPTPQFYSQEEEKDIKVDWSFVLKYLTTYKKLLVQLSFGLIIGIILQFVTPFLTQSIVDIGISGNNLNFIVLILSAQIMLVLGRTSVEFIRSWILLHISSRVNISILTDFLIKLMKLPMSFFDTKMTGDIMQRINDQRRIESFLTGSVLDIMFSAINLLVFAAVLAYYKLDIFLVFTIGSAAYIGWIVIFLKKRRELDYRSFDISSKNQSSILQLVEGMQEIKLNNYEQQKRWEWEAIQARLFRLNVKSLALTQYQQAGATLINEGKNIFVTFLSAVAVLNGDITLGAMLAIQYIIGQLNGPIEQFIVFVQRFQDAKISLERLNEIHELADEEPTDKVFSKSLPSDKSLYIQNLTFRYPGAGNAPVLQNIDLLIPQGKTTAIVGMSGSGKTTILKLLLRFYEPESGEIKIGGNSLNYVSYDTWRSQCGVVMQDGYIFSDTIANNITVGDPHPDKERLFHAISVSNISDFVESLPLGLKTKIGAEGNGISQGQRQRLLIARAVYKNPEYIFFDEATNALDSNNERVIMTNLQNFLIGKTVVVVAHRLSTVSNADNIIVLDKGRVIEQGAHAELVRTRGNYYQLVKNQLELGK